MIKIDKFNGEAPSRSPRALGEYAAISSDLNAKSAEFIPLRENATVATAGVSNPKTLFRLERKSDGSLNTDTTTNWIASSALRSYAKGQIDDDTTGRTYYTTDDSDVAPRAIDALGTDKLLGVPAPTTKPTVKLLASDEFTENEYDELVTFKIKQVAYAVRVNATSTIVGAFGGIQGYLEGVPEAAAQATNTATGATADIDPSASTTPIFYDGSTVVVGASVSAIEALSDPVYLAKVAAIQGVFYPLIATPSAAVAALIAVPYTYAEAFDALQQAYWGNSHTGQIHNLHMFMQVNYLTDGTYGKKIWPQSELNLYWDWFVANHDGSYRGNPLPIDRTSQGNIWQAAQHISGCQEAIDNGASEATSAPWRT